jgi:hypothetical protein
MKHLIKKQLFLLTIPPGTDAFRAQHAASRLYRERLLPALERIFDELSGEDEVIYLDQCSIDLGSIAGIFLDDNRIDEALFERMKQEVRKEIGKAVVLSPQNRSSLRESVVAQWWYYMEQGRLTWRSGGFTDVDYRKVLELFSVDYAAISLLRTIISEKPRMLVRISAQNPVWFLEKLVAVLTSSRQEGLGSVVNEVFQLYTWLEVKYHEMKASRQGRTESRGRPRPDESLATGLTWWTARVAGFLRSPGHERKHLIWRRLLIEAAARPLALAKNGAVTFLLHDIPDSPALLKTILEEAGSGVDNTGIFTEIRIRLGALKKRDGTKDIGGNRDGSEKKPVAPKDERGGTKGIVPETEEMGPGQPGQKDPERASRTTPAMEGGAGDENTGREGTVDDAVAAADEPARGGGPEDEDLYSLATRKDIPAQTTPPERQSIDEDGIYLPFAGLILLHPFLSTLFLRLGYWDGSAFTEPAAQLKAVFLLYFLATGDHDPPEHALVFPKMLCGLELETPVPGSIDLTDEEYGEAELLLQEVIRQWGKLGNSSTEGLREGFLQRRGKLSDKGGKCCLQVETTGIDALLDYLPWNLAMVKLPWLKEILFVDWR